MALAHVELDLPSANQGAFIPGGDTWNGYAAIVKLLSNSGEDALIVDPYLDGSFIIDFLPLANSLREVRCLTSDRYKVSIVAAGERWIKDNKPDQALRIRTVEQRELHDRLIIFGPAEVHLVTQSFKDIAARSPASVQRVSSETAAMKSDHYCSVWEAAEPIVECDPNAD